jgi:ubiquinone/menaquinone biosynthesis C-methylase UbiE
MPDYQEIYNSQAGKYDLFASREDYQGNVLRALNRVRPFDGLDVIELGAGTARLTCMIAPLVKAVLAVDVSPHMLDVAIAKLDKTGLQNWTVAVADNRALPVVDQVADLSLAGWSLGHFTSWYPEHWRDEIERALAQMKRVLRPGGTAIIVETLGTGWEEPHPPTEALAAYYALLEGEHGFSRIWIRTDYRFASLSEAEDLTRFFFDDLADQVVTEELVVLPECTGIWYRDPKGLGRPLGS